MGKLVRRTAVALLALFATLVAPVAETANDQASCLGRALELDGGSDGTGDLVFVGPRSELQITGDLTLEAWARIDVLPSLSTCSSSCPATSVCSSLPTCAPTFLVTTDLGGFEVAAQNTLYWFGVQANGSLRDRWEAFSGSPDVDMISSMPGPLQLGEWHHFAATRDVTNREVRFYLDGMQVGTTQTFGPTPNGGAQAETVIGASKNVFGAFSGFLDGAIDEVRIWQTVRSPAELLTSMHTPLTGSESGLVGYWPMDEDSGQVVVDSSPSANDGSLGETLAPAADDPTRIDCCVFAPDPQPSVVERARGKPGVEAIVWESCGGEGLLLVRELEVSAALVFLNGELVVGPQEFPLGTSERTVPVTLETGQNILQVEVRGRPGARLELELVPGTGE